jgi:hypothetical protein
MGKIKDWWLTQRWRIESNYKIIELVLTTIAIVVAGLLYYVTQNQLQHQINVDASNDSTQHLRDSISRASFEAQTRAYLVINDVSPTEGGSPINGVTVYYENVGKTPAYNVRKNAINNIKNILSGKDIRDMEVGVDTIGATVGTTKPYPIDVPSIINISNYAAFSDNKIKMIIYGIILYEDIFHKQHFTHFAYTWDHQFKRFIIYSKYNDAN